MEKKFNGISGSTLKIIAVITMFIDHTGSVIVGRILNSRGLPDIAQLDPDALTSYFSADPFLYLSYFILRCIGRISFPLFCFLLVQGFCHTHDIKKYALRLGIFALISEIPYDLAVSSTLVSFNHQNIFFTLFIGLLTMYACRTIEDSENTQTTFKTVFTVIIMVIGMTAAELLNTDYGAIGVFCILILYLTRYNKSLQILSGCLSSLYQFPAPLAFLFVKHYNEKRGLNIKYFFYAFYPVHLLLLYLISVGIGIGSFPGL